MAHCDEGSYSSVGTIWADRGTQSLAATNISTHPPYLPGARSQLRAVARAATPTRRKAGRQIAWAVCCQVLNGRFEKFETFGTKPAVAGRVHAGLAIGLRANTTGADAGSARALHCFQQLEDVCEAIQAMLRTTAAHALGNLAARGALDHDTASPATTKDSI
jgi:hypothetical protein